MVIVVNFATPADTAEIIEVCALVTEMVVTVKPALVNPAGTVTWPRVLAKELLLDRLTTVPPVGAGAVSETVQELLVPPVMLLGEHATEDTLGCETCAVVRVREKFRTLPFRLAVSITVVFALTVDDAAAVNPMLVVPFSIVTGDETVTFELLLEIAIFVLLLAAPLKLTVQAAVPGGFRLPGVHVRFDSTGAAPPVSVTGKVLVTPFRTAEIVTGVFELTDDAAVAVNPMLLVPVATVTGDDTVNFALLLETDTFVLLAADPLRLTMQEVVPGGVRLAGVHVTLDNTGPAG